VSNRRLCVILTSVWPSLYLQSFPIGRSCCHTAGCSWSGQSQGDDTSWVLKVAVFFVFTTLEFSEILASKLIPPPHPHWVIQLMSGQIEVLGTPCDLWNIQVACHSESRDSLQMPSDQTGGLDEPFYLWDLRGACHSVLTGSIGILLGLVCTSFWMGLGSGQQLANVTVDLGHLKTPTFSRGSLEHLAWSVKQVWIWRSCTGAGHFAMVATSPKTSGWTAKHLHSLQKWGAWGRYLSPGGFCPVPRLFRRP